jgi:hypothetical protein
VPGSPDHGLGDSGRFGAKADPGPPLRSTGKVVATPGTLPSGASIPVLRSGAVGESSAHERALLVIVVAVLLVTLGCQIYRYLQLEHSADQRPLAIGKPLPISLVDLEGTIVIDLACRTAFIIEPECPHCQYLAASFSIDTIAGPHVPLLMSVGDSASTFDFYRRFPNNEVVRFDVPQRLSGWRLLRYLDVPVVPTRLNFGAEAEVVDIRITTSLVPSDALVRGCSSQGPPPRTHQGEK